MPRISEGARKTASRDRGGIVLVSERHKGRKSRSVRDGVVYFIAAESVGTVKIGRTKDLKKRLGSLQTSSPTPLDLLGAVPGGAANELFLHAYFADDRRHGEWFTLTDAIREVASTGELPESKVGIGVGDVQVTKSEFRRFALIERAIAEGHDSPTLIARTLDIHVEDLRDLLIRMRAFGLLRGSYDPRADIYIVP